MANNQLHTALTISAGVEGINDIRRLADTIEEAGGNVDNLRQSANALESAWGGLSTDEQTQQLNQLSTQAERLRQLTSARMTLGLTGDDEVRQQIVDVTNAYNQLRQSGTLTSEELARATQLHTQQVAQLESQLGQARPTMQDIASEMGNIVASAGGLAYVVKEAMKFETAMADVKKVVDGTPEQIQALSSEVQKMAVELGMSSEAVAQITAQGGQLGVPLEKLGEFTRMAGQMSVAFNMTAEEAGDAAAKMANVWNIPIDKVGELGDAINTLGNTTAAKEREIVDVMNRIGGTAKQFGLAKEEAAALSAAFISLGKTPETAGTAINALLTKLSTASVQSDDFKNALAHIGISADQLAKDINDNPQKALSNFLQTLGTLSKEQQSIATFKLFGQEYVDDISILVGGLDTYNKALGEVSDKSQTAGAMQKEFEARMDTTSASLEQAKASVGVLAQTIGTQLLPIITSTLDVFTDVVGGVTSFAETYPNLTKFITIVASAQVGLVALNSTLRLIGTTGLLSFGQLATGATTATGAITGATTATAGLNTALSATAKSAVALTGAFMAGNAIGDWAYENIGAVRTLGDELGRGLAYLDAIFTERTFDDVRDNFETSAESAKRLANETKNAKTANDELAQSATANAQKQAQSHIELANNIKVTTAELESMELTLARMEASGKTGSDAHKALATEIANTKDKLELLKVEAQKQGIGELLKTDLEKASESFKTLGLDIKEFETGISSDATTALNAFVEVAKLAGDDTDKLARAYNAVKEKIGESAEAQEMLNFKLAQATNGNKELAQSVKDTAQAQLDAKNATDEQAKALDALGVSMSAINAGMSQSGQKMADNLKVGLSVIKDTAKGADELKVALNQALDTALASAKTQADFKAIQEQIANAGLTAQVSAENMAKLNTGINGNSQAVQDNTQKTTQNTQAKTANANASHEVAQAQEIEAEAINKTTKAISVQTAGLDDLGLSTEKIAQIQQGYWDMLKGKMGGTYTTAFMGMLAMQKQEREAMQKLNSELEIMGQKLGQASVEAKTLTEAQQLLQKASNATMAGIKAIDDVRLSKLREQIAQTEQKMSGLVDTARQTAQALQSELASLNGDETEVMRLKHTQKLADLESKLAEARARNNAEEIKHYENAIKLQRQINDIESKKAKENATNNPTLPNPSMVNVKTNQGKGADDVVKALQQSLYETEQRAKAQAKTELVNELIQGIKTRAR